MTECPPENKWRHANEKNVCPCSPHFIRRSGGAPRKAGKKGPLSPIDIFPPGKHNGNRMRKEPFSYGYYLYHRAPEPGHGLHRLRHGLRRPPERPGQPAVPGRPAGPDQRRDPNRPGPLRLPAPQAHRQRAHPGPGPGLRHAPHPLRRRHRQPGVDGHAGGQDLHSPRGQRGRDPLRHPLRRGRGQLRHDHRP